VSVSPRVAGALRRLARVALAPPLREPARRLARRRGWLPAPSPDADPFRYPFAEIMAHHQTPYPQYLWGTMCAAQLASALGYERISAIELGVAGGNGLLELERLASWVARRAGVGIEVIGFDSGAGLPRPRDHRDLPNLWSEGYFAMDHEALRARLSGARLALGPVAETVRRFLEEDPAPIGFVSFDLDLYSSTVDALALFCAPEALLLPRVVCYFDDIIGFSHNDYAGERLAIREFNDAHEHRKLSPLYGLRWVVGQERWWVEQMFMLHCFRHPRYGDFDASNTLSQLPLRGP
jgi:hypothetical protein